MYVFSLSTASKKNIFQKSVIITIIIAITITFLLSYYINFVHLLIMMIIIILNGYHGIYKFLFQVSTKIVAYFCRKLNMIPR